jgi:hypothetical protein
MPRRCGVEHRKTGSVLAAAKIQRPQDSRALVENALLKTRPRSVGGYPPVCEGRLRCTRNGDGENREGYSQLRVRYRQTREVRRAQDQLNEGTTWLNVAIDCQIAATHRRLAMSKQTRKHDFGGGPWTGKPKRDTSRLEDASAKQRKQHAHKAPVRRAASKFRG